MVKEFAEQCKAADYKLTLTGSWIEDREQYPDFWSDVYLWWTVEESQERTVETLLKGVGGTEAGDDD